MPNLERLGLQNFRTFEKKGDIKFAPITIITGANNAGKSSIIKAIQLLADNLKDGVIREQLDFSGMRHELGGLKRILNQTVVANSIDQKADSKYSRISKIKDKFGKEKNGGIIKKPILDSKSDLVFTIPIEIGSTRRLEAELELRYHVGTDFSHSIKSIAIIYLGEHLHWSNISGLNESFDQPPEWQMHTSFDLKLILDTIFKNPSRTDIGKFKKSDDLIQGNSETDFFRKENGSIYFDFPYLRSDKDEYTSFLDKFEDGKSLFSSYEKLSDEKRVEKKNLEISIFEESILGSSNGQYSILESFKRPFDSVIGHIEEKINALESSLAPDEKMMFTRSFKLSENAKLYRNLHRCITEDFIKGAKVAVSKFRNIYQLNTLRGRNREWFIDEQEGDSIQLIKDFANNEPRFSKAINSFLSFWIGKGETIESGKKVNKGFNIGKKVKIVRTEEIGLTKLFLENFDGTLTPLIDLGFGISQLLPILMKIALIAKKQTKIHLDFDDSDWGPQEIYIDYLYPSTLLIEEPESNLHPALQSKLAEVFLDASSRFNIQFIIETHSEYLIYKLQEYIGKKKISTEDIAIYYLNDPASVKEGSEIKYVNRVDIKEDGSIDYEKYFGKGFFDEQTNLKLSLLNIQRERFFELFEQTKSQFNASSSLDEEQQFQHLTNIIDQHFEKLNFTTHENRVKSNFPNHSKFQPNTRKYLATAYHLMEIYDDDHSITDYAPAIIQLGRAVESEWTHLFKSAKDFIIDQGNHEEFIRNFKSESSALVANHKFEFKTFMNESERNMYKISFGNMRHVIRLLKIDSANLEMVNLLKEFNNYLENIYFKNWSTVKASYPTDLDVIVSVRNEAAHTYSNSELTQQIALNYKNIVEPFLKSWSDEKM